MVISSELLHSNHSLRPRANNHREQAPHFKFNPLESILDYTEIIGLEMNRNEIKWFVIDYETEKNYIDQKFLLICFELKTCWAQGLKFSGLNS